MDTEAQTRRTINYLTDIVDELTLINSDEPKLSYEQVYQRFNEARQYILSSFPADEVLRNEAETLPTLVRPTIFNRDKGGILTVAILGLVNPFATILILTITFPISLPYLTIRAFVTRETKSRTDEAKFRLTRIVNRLKEQTLK
jgi:hypothetical protein